MQISVITDENLIKSYISKLYSELFGETKVPTSTEFDSIFEALPAYGHTAYEVKIDDQAVAFFTLSESFSFFASGRYGIINELWVCQDQRANGVGSKVIDEIITLAKEHKWSRVDVSAPPNTQWDRTFAFYQKCGFEFTGRKLKRYL
ncbi:GNAT family N-acetyltransferase [Pseudoalteromonas luteoviolacea]|uniref:GNAT family N-acetyltransferase n=1 Tax=Pseudoalteromonas luteoviolacea TaxID=43657 RepID=UPI001B3A2E95|nr:GNAT family N-acetyltransferase [Pseudoalteromonas luteoviolacea]MBQ4879965.1 GNAT family N-acetyltransferase [Pseudoalteromonas luteoviolacea]MBQ4908982.1 GNAT family N-acetyltransferase [Pseudoalteromonas luteoviolacea]